jgi:hypothetical protein
VVAQGNIIDGDELEMTSKSKTFAVALSREMVPTARIVVYFLRQPEEIVSDVLNFFVNGTRLNDVSYTPTPAPNPHRHPLFLSLQLHFSCSFIKKSCWRFFSTIFLLTEPG